MLLSLHGFSLFKEALARYMLLFVRSDWDANNRSLTRLSEGNHNTVPDSSGSSSLQFSEY